MVERGPEKAGVGGSIPSLATIYNQQLSFNLLTYDVNAAQECRQERRYKRRSLSGISLELITDLN